MKMIILTLQRFQCQSFSFDSKGYGVPALVLGFDRVNVSLLEATL